MGKAPNITTVIYVIGEVVISLVAIIGAFLVLYFSTDQGTKLAAVSVLSAATVFWFQRRQAEQANNNMATLANGKLTQMLDNQAQQQARTDMLVGLMAGSARTSLIEQKEDKPT